MKILPLSVTCICSMEIQNASYKQFLKSDCFPFALGTEEGHFMLLAIDQNFKFCAGAHQLDLNIVHYVTPDGILQKRVFFKPPLVLVIPLNDSMYRVGKFVLEPMHESDAVLSLRQEEISATADDPRQFCYLTVVARKSCEAYAAPYALLYSLSYVIKEVVSEGLILYEDLQYITLRWDLNFGPLILPEDSDEENVELLTCESLASSISHGNPRATTGYGLCYFAMTWKSGVYS
ncbi:hypothetical protein DAPPUDRAFT_256590 [Daphnia pulex]|uniref:Uncharacterized protein n=1 Tax=Daphnia pulex TaxID=6669 RepID=E9HBQ1_DAPPU|nr:hypothetical protein DAPPUDRAFT_256590 [Daphnia pulex]|eukprot:EFX70756.1 hypothetical protein DAPPUDRAFT_256590 [Daphnia pulex]